MPDPQQIDPSASYSLREAVMLPALYTLGREALRLAIVAGTLPATRTPDGWRVTGADLASWLQHRRAKHPPLPPDFLSASEAAGQIGVSSTTVYQAIAQGRLPAQRSGGRWIVARADVEVWRATCRSDR